MDIAAALVPVVQDPALAAVAVDRMQVAGGAMRVAVDQPRVAVLTQGPLDRCLRHIHDLRARPLLVFFALGAHSAYRCPAQGQGQAQEQALVYGIASEGTEFLILHIVGAQRIAVHEESPDSVEIEERRVRQQLRAAVRGKGLPDQHVAVAMHEMKRDPFAAQSVQCVGDRSVERVGEVVVAHPVFEQVAEDEDGLRPRRNARREIEEHLVDVRPLGGEMQVGDENAVHFRLELAKQYPGPFPFDKLRANGPLKAFQAMPFVVSLSNHERRPDAIHP